MTVMAACFITAGRTQPQWTTEAALAEWLQLEATPNRVLALWGDDLTVVAGSVSEIRDLLVRSLALIPED